MIDWRDKYPNNSTWASRYNPISKNVSDYVTNNELYVKNLKFLNESDSINKAALQAEKKKLEDEVKRNQRSKTTKLILGIFAVAAFISITLAVWGFRSRSFAIVKATEANKQRSLAENSAQEANIQRSLAVVSAKEANRQRILAEGSAKEARQQKSLAMRYAKEAEIQKDSAIKQKFIAQKEAFESKLKDKDWWDMSVLNETLSNSIKDTLFNLYFHPIDKNPNHADTLLATKFENSLNLLYEAEEQKSDDWGLYLHLVKEAKEYHDNYITRAVFDSLMRITIKPEKKFTFPFSSNSSYDTNVDYIYSLTLLPDNEIIAVATNGVHFLDKTGNSRKLMSLDLHVVPISNFQ
jgi:uncharacterized membrane protein